VPRAPFALPGRLAFAEDDRGYGLPTQRSECVGETIELSDGAGTAYRATPSTDQGSGVLVLHAWWGLNETARGFCDRLADAGFIAVAPDLYRGTVVDTPEAAEAELEAMPGAERLAIARSAMDRLRGEPGVRAASLGVIGFSMGAFYTLQLAADDPSVAAAVLCYGTGPSGDWTTSDVAFQGHFAEDDPFEPAADVDALEAALREGGRRVEFHRYPAARHWFLEPDRPEYDESAANLAWGRILAFLRERLD
jgi:carboxymethylenebutenolidase